VARASAYLLLARPGNAALAALGVLAGAIGAAGRYLPTTPVLLVLVAGALGVAGGNALNDALDADVDRTAHPRRPIPRGLVTVGQSKAFGIACIVAAILLAGLVNAWTLALAALLAGNLVLYEYHAKGHGILGHALVSYNAGALFLLGGLATMGGPFVRAVPPLDARVLAPLAMAVLASLLNLARELYKSVEDAEHDARERRTFAVTAGPQRARRLGDAVAWATVPIALVPVALRFFDGLYLPLVAPLLLLLLVVPFVGKARTARALLKFGMVLGFVPFLVPKLI